MSRAEDLKQKADRLRAANASNVTAASPVSNPEDASVATEVRSYVPQSRPVVRTKPVRLSVDIPPAEHAQLVRLAMSAADELGLARVHGQEIVRVLISRYLADPGQQREVLADVAARRQER